jgi:hypothetical protein
MSDPRVLKWLRKIDSNIDLMRTERDSALAEIDAELEAHKGRLDGHDTALADHEARLRRLERKRDDEKV